jgi:UDP-glucose 4-epimerase
VRALVTGGAGYIGSHMVRALLDAGHAVVVLDDLSTGHRDAVAGQARLVEGNVGATRDVSALIRDERIDAVFHFAGLIRVDESVANPRKYFYGNLVASLGLLDAVLEAGRTIPFVFSSTAAVYGEPASVPIDEEHPQRPVNPYGDSKLAVERVLETYGKAHGLPWAALRYFNAAGAYAEAGLGERHEPESHLVPIVLEVAAGTRAAVSIYGTDWPTPDGTCVRDFIHVRDLCDAHLAAIEHLRKGGASGAMNLGTGEGHSVREVVEVARAITGHPIPVVEGPKRAGDPPALVARVDRAARILGWKAARADLPRIVQDAWTWKTWKRGPEAG